MSARQPRVLIGSSSEAEDWALELGAELARTREVSVTHWRDIFPPNHGFLGSLLDATRKFDAALFVGFPDDRVERRGAQYSITRDNVIFEFGLFLGSLGSDRAYLVVPDDWSIALPTDLMGISVFTWSAGESNHQTAMRLVGARLRRRIVEVGPMLARAYGSQFVSREQLANVLPSAVERVCSASGEIMISGNDCKFVVESMSPHIRAALDRGVAVQVICADPEGPGVADMLALVDPRFTSPGSFKASMQSVSAQLEELQSSNSLFSFGYLPILPPFAMFFVDPSQGGPMKVEMITTKPFGAVESRPHLLLDEADDEWRSYFLQQWSNLWALCRKGVG